MGYIPATHNHTCQSMLELATRSRETQAFRNKAALVSASLGLSRLASSQREMLLEYNPYGLFFSATESRMPDWARADNEKW